MGRLKVANALHGWPVLEKASKSKMPFQHVERVQLVIPKPRKMKNKFDYMMQDSFLAAYGDAGGTFDVPPEIIKETLESDEDRAKQLWRESGTKLSFGEWIDKLERKADRKAKWRERGSQLFDIGFKKLTDWLGGDRPVKEEPDIQFDDNGGVKKAGILGMPTGVAVGVGVVLLAGVGYAIYAATKK
jgi:hypothetical protein